MQIVWDHQAVQELKKSHTVLELETFDANGIPVTTYCVVPAEKIGINGFSSLDRYVELHAGFIKAFKDGNVELCKDCAEHLMGQFGGELDSFYTIILDRITTIDF